MVHPASLSAATHATVGHVWDLTPAGVIQGTGGGTALNFVSPVHGDLTAPRPVPARTEPRVILSPESAPAPPGGWGLFAVKSVQQESMDKIAGMFADVRMVVCATMYQGHVPVTGDGKELCVIVLVHLANTAPTVRIPACARTMGTATR